MLVGGGVLDTLFWDCASVHEVWAVSKLFPTEPRLHFSSFMDVRDIY